MRAISNEKRKLIIAAKERGEKEDVIALWLDVSKRSVATIWKLYRTKGDILPTKNAGRPSRLNKATIDRITDEVDRVPDIALHELIEKLSLPIKKSQLSRLLIRLGLTFKKNALSKKPAQRRCPAETRKLARDTKDFRSRKAGFP